MREQKSMLLGRCGVESNAWRGGNACYSAIHTWVRKHWGRANHCDLCHCKKPSRYEWSNLNKKYRRVREDWIQLCPSCHRISDIAFIREQIYGGDACINGHLRTTSNTMINIRGHKVCRICSIATKKRFRLRQQAVVA